MTIKVTQDNLDLMARGVNLLSLPEMESLSRMQEKLENELIQVIARDLSKNKAGKLVKPEDIGVDWIVVQRSRNSAAFAVELAFSEAEEEGDPGYKTDAVLRKYVQDSILLALLDTKMLPPKATVSAWVHGLPGGTYAERARY